MRTFEDVARLLHIGDEIDWLPDRPLDSAWLEHAPFAFWIVKAVRPRVLVELGTYSGYSYFAFCQAIRRLHLATKSFAIDTWKGDAHASFYSEEVYKDFLNYHDSHYRAFSSVIRADFDQARPYFADRSIDILHIDGFHSYEQVSHDFASWKETLSESGIVLLHDVNVRERDFGVWRLWEELKREYPHFEFVHGHGLGILGVGNNQCPPMRELFALGQDDAATAFVRSAYANRGANIRGKADDMSQGEECANDEPTELSREVERLRAVCDELASKLQRAEQETAHASATHDELLVRLMEAEARERSILDSTAWRITGPVRRSLSSRPRLRKLIRRGVKLTYWTATFQLGHRLKTWRGTRGTLSAGGRQHASAAHENVESCVGPQPAEIRLEDLDVRPLISIVLPTYNTDERLLRSCLDSVIGQTYPHWELCVADDHSTQGRVRHVLNEYARKDDRIRVTFRETNGNISAATNSALALSSGEFVAFLDHDDLLLPDALLRCVSVIARLPETDVVYTDLAIESVNRSSRVEFRKPDWSPTFFRGVMYVGHLLLARRTLVEEVGRLDSKYDGVQDYELMLRLSERTNKIEHVPEILYIWRAVPGSIAAGTDNKPIAKQKQLEAVNAHLTRVGISGAAIAHPAIPHRATLVPSRDTKIPSATLIVEVKQRKRAERLIATLSALSPGLHIQNVLVSPRLHLSDWLSTAAPKARVLTDDGTPGSTHAVNLAAREAESDLLIFMSDAWAPSADGWARELCFHLADEHVGLVAPMLLDAAGMVYASGLGVEKSGKLAPLLSGHIPDSDGYFGALAVAREVSAVPNACFAVRKDDFDDLGGFNRYLANGFRAADLSFSLSRRGRRTVVVPHCRFAPIERDALDFEDPLEAMTFHDRWKDELAVGERYWRS